jgi:hypothetical protein
MSHYSGLFSEICHLKVSTISSHDCICINYIKLLIFLLSIFAKCNLDIRGCDSFFLFAKNSKAVSKMCIYGVHKNIARIRNPMKLLITLNRKTVFASFPTILSNPKSLFSHSSPMKSIVSSVYQINIISPPSKSPAFMSD